MVAQWDDFHFSGNFKYALWSCVVCRMLCIIKFPIYFLLHTETTKWKWKTLNDTWCKSTCDLYAFEISAMSYNFCYVLPQFQENWRIVLFCCCFFHSIQFEKEMKWKMVQEFYANWIENFIIQDAVCLCMCVCRREMWKMNEWMSVMWWQSETDSKI